MFCNNPLKIYDCWLGDSIFLSFFFCDSWFENTHKQFRNRMHVLAFAGEHSIVLWSIWDNHLRYFDRYYSRCHNACNVIRFHWVQFYRKQKFGERLLFPRVSPIFCYFLFFSFLFFVFGFQIFSSNIEMYDTHCIFSIQLFVCVCILNNWMLFQPEIVFIFAFWSVHLKNCLFFRLLFLILWNWLTPNYYHFATYF